MESVLQPKIKKVPESEETSHINRTDELLNYLKESNEEEINVSSLRRVKPKK